MGTLRESATVEKSAGLEQYAGQVYSRVDLCQEEGAVALNGMVQSKQ